MALSWWLLSLPISLLHILLTPPNSFLSGTVESGQIFVIGGLFFCSIAPGLAIGNLLAWLIAPLRRILDREATSFPTTTFRSSLASLTKAGIGILVFGYPVALLGSLDYVALTDSRISVHQGIGFHSAVYTWDKVKNIRTQCWKQRNSNRGSFVVSFEDGKSVDLFIGATRFFAAYPTMGTRLNGVPFTFEYRRTLDRSGVAAPLCSPSWLPYFSRRPS